MNERGGCFCLGGSIVFEAAEMCESDHSEPLRTIGCQCHHTLVLNPVGAADSLFCVCPFPPCMAAAQEQQSSTLPLSTPLCRDCTFCLLTPCLLFLNTTETDCVRRRDKERAAGAMRICRAGLAQWLLLHSPVQRCAAQLYSTMPI